MLGHSEQTNCPYCNSPNLMTHIETKPYNISNGDCLNCGFSYYTKETQSTLKEVNQMRKSVGLPALKKLKKIIK